MPTRGVLNGDPLPFNEVDSINSLFRGQVVLGDGSTKSCLLKDIDRVELVNELVSNLIASKLNLPVPLAVLALVEDRYNKKNYFPKSVKVKGGRLVFCTIDVQTPNLAQRLKSAHPLSEKIISNSLISWSKKGHLYGFDTWVANVDRHMGNILFGARNEMWLIDHGRCFTKENWVPSDLVPDVTYANRLQSWYTKLLDQLVRLKTKQDLHQVQAEISNIDLNEVLKESFADQLTTPEEQKALINFLSVRTGRVVADGAIALQG